MWMLGLKELRNVGLMAFGHIACIVAETPAIKRNFKTDDLTIKLNLKICVFKIKWIQGPFRDNITIKEQQSNNTLSSNGTCT